MAEMNEVSEISRHRLAAKPARRNVKLSDIVISVVIIAAIAVLASYLFSQLSLKHEASAARGTTNKMIADIQKQDANDAWNLGSASFKAKYTPEELGNLFKPLSGALKGSQTVVKQTVTNGSKNKVVSIYYHFTQPQTYYVAVTVVQPNGKTGWQMINFSGSPTESVLVK